MSKPRKPKSLKLTTREKKIVEARAKGKSLTDAAKEAGYKGEFAGQAGYRALKSAKAKVPDLFARHGLDDDSFIRDHVIARLNARTVKVFNGENGIVYSDPLEDNATRMAATRLVAEMKGMLNRETEGQLAGIKFIIVDASHRPPRQVAKVIDIPGLPMPHA